MDENINLIRRLKARGLNVDEIAKVTNLTTGDVEVILKDLYKVGISSEDVKIETFDAYSEIIRDLTSLISSQLDRKKEINCPKCSHIILLDNIEFKIVLEAIKLKTDLLEKKSQLTVRKKINLSSF